MTFPASSLQDWWWAVLRLFCAFCIYDTLRPCLRYWAWVKIEAGCFGETPPWRHFCNQSGNTATELTKLSLFFTFRYSRRTIDQWQIEKWSFLQKVGLEYTSKSGFLIFGDSKKHLFTKFYIFSYLGNILFWFLLKKKEFKICYHHFLYTTWNIECRQVVDIYVSTPSTWYKLLLPNS